MILFVFGILTGILLTFIVLVLMFPEKETVCPSIQPMEENFRVVENQKAQFIEPTEIEDEAIAAVIEENEKRGKSTKVSEL